jgi:hypothetical protein
MEPQTTASTVQDSLANASRDRDEIREDIRQRGSNVNFETLLATDYLNHFNEIVMMVELAADMPEAFDLTATWEPLEYDEHFRRSNLSDKDLAIEAYKHCPDDVRTEFDGTVQTLEDYLVEGLQHAGAALAASESGAFHTICRDLSMDVRGYIDRLSAIIHGRDEPISTKQALDNETLEEAQHTIDCLFGT